MRKRSRQKWIVGDLFLVPTLDGQFVVGQIVGREAEVLNSVSVAFFDVRVSSKDVALARIAELGAENVFSVVFTTRDSLDLGAWPILGNRPAEIRRESLPYESLRVKEFVGAKVYGSGIINEFINAFYALSPWDDWKDPNYLDALLLLPEKKPENLLYMTHTRSQRSS